MVGSRQGIARHRRLRGRVSGRSSPDAPEAPEGSQTAPGLDGAEGNERLTAMTGAVLLIGLAIECYTILRIGRLLTLHVFLGMLLLGPVVLKAGSVLYRFVRYYTGSAPYRRKGPPALLLRVIGPIILLLTACVFGSGIMLAVTGPGYGPPGGWLEVHRISFIAWAFFVVIHVLAYVPRVPRRLTPRPPRRPRHPAGFADRLTPRRPGDRPAHGASRGQVGVIRELLVSELLASRARAIAIAVST